MLLIAILILIPLFFFNLILSSLKIVLTKHLKNESVEFKKSQKDFEKAHKRILQFGLQDTNLAEKSFKFQSLLEDKAKQKADHEDRIQLGSISKRLHSFF